MCQNNPEATKIGFNLKTNGLYLCLLLRRGNTTEGKNTVPVKLLHPEIHCKKKMMIECLPKCLDQKLCFSCPTMIKPGYRCVCRKPSSAVADAYGIQGQVHGSRLCRWPTAQVDPIGVWHMRS